MANRTQLAQLYTSIYDEFLDLSFNKYESGTMKAATEKDTTQKDYIVNGLSDLGMWEQVDEGSTTTPEDPVQDYKKTYTITKKQKLIQVTFEAADDDEYALLEKQGDASMLGTGARDKLSYDLAQVLYNAFSVAGPDGQYGFDSDHPKNSEETGTTYSNLLSGAFSHDNLEAAETAITNNLYSLKGSPIPITQDPILLYPPALRGPVERVLNERAMERPTTANRDINQFTQRKGTFKYIPVEDVWLNSANGGSDTAWYIMFPWMGFFKLVWRQKPKFVSWLDYETDMYNFKGTVRYDVGYDNWRMGFASTGL